MRRLFEALAIDYDHWKALTLTALRIDLRASRLGGAHFGHQEVKAAGLLIGQFIFYSAMGVAVALLVWFSRDLFLAATTVVTYVMFMIATTALLDHNAAIVSPDDHAILGFRPLTSRTYFAARLANMLVYTTVMTTVFSYVPIVAFFVRHGVAVGEIRRRYGAEGNGISIYVTDPEGNMVELKGPSDGQPPPASP